jgi:hypothetical protein
VGENAERRNRFHIFGVFANLYLAEAEMRLTIFSYKSFAAALV